MRQSVAVTEVFVADPLWFSYLAYTPEQRSLKLEPKLRAYVALLSKRMSLDES